MDSTAIKVENVSKVFKLPHEKNTSIKSSVVNFWHRDRGFEIQHALKDVSFEIKKGEFFGIVGRNGSGKSTLLKLLAGIYTPTKGKLQINGNLTPFIELGVGFNPELTGRENVYLNGALLGFNRKEMTTMYNDIVAFAELERFMDQKLKNYSSGMQVRLAFSIAIRAKSDILLIDEVLAVGDQSFQEKCFNYFMSIKNSDKTIVFVTHDMSNVERFCDRVYVLDKSLKDNGIYKISEAVALYNKLNHLSKQVSNYEKDSKLDVFIKRIQLLNEKGKPSYTFEQGKPMIIRIKLGHKESISPETPITLGISIHDEQQINLAGPNSQREKLSLKNEVFEYRIPSLPFNLGKYNLTVGLFDEKTTKQYDLVNKELHFFVNTSTTYHGKFVIDGQWVANG